jgi:hypothetical protein
MDKHVHSESTNESLLLGGRAKAVKTVAGALLRRWWGPQEHGWALQALRSRHRPVASKLRVADWPFGEMPLKSLFEAQPTARTP